LASAAALMTITAVLATGSLPAQAAVSPRVVATASLPAQAGLSHRLDAISPDTISPNSQLQAVSAVSPTDAWAVGDYITYNSAHLYASAPLIEHWNGTSWTKVTGLRPSQDPELELTGVSAISATDAWAVGYYSDNGGGKTLTLHWNGKTWAQVKSPSPTTKKNWFLNLSGVSTVSATDAWAVGEYTKSAGSGVYKPLILHWNGKTWTQVTSPLPSGATVLNLNGVSAVSATDAWAVGGYYNSSGLYVPVIQHWNGKTWTQVKSPAPSGSPYIQLWGVSSDSATDVWAVGDYESSSRAFVPLALHRDAATWSQVKSPVPSGAEETYMNGVSADSATDVWAVGRYQSSTLVRLPGGGKYYPVETVVLHWNGTAWKIVKNPNGTL
jgi:hypothetical protein